jgi:HAD superfamily hydrolase (TIGR01509 family)
MFVHENNPAGSITAIEGHLVSGLGRAADFTRIDWVRRQLIDLFGIDPHPGTLNLALRDEANRARWQSWRSMPGHVIEPEDGNFCRAHCYPVQIAGRIPAAVLVPETADYPEDKIELVAALPIREHLALAADTRVNVDLCRPIAAKGVLFDIDGTLVDSVGAYIQVARVAAEPFGLAVTEEHVRHALATGGNFWKGIVPQDRSDGDVIRKALSANAAREWPRVLREHGRMLEGVAQTLAALKTRGMKLGIVSGARPEVLELLRADGVLNLFDAVVLGTDVSRSKPDPEGIVKCLGLLDVYPDEAVYVGDAPVDIQASRAAGVRVVSVLTGAGDSAMLSAHYPDRLISSHTKLSAIVESA